MISPPNIAAGTAVIDLNGRDGEIMANTFKHSISLTLVLSVIVMLQRYACP